MHNTVRNNYLDKLNILFNKDKSDNLLIAALVIIICTVFYPSLSNWFVYWDDPEYILENKNLFLIGNDWSWHAIKHIFTSEVGANYDPLPILTYAIEKYFFALDVTTSPFIYHLDNLLLHLVCSTGVFIFFKKLGLKKGAAFLGALLFGIHPMRVESVAWITERKDVLYGMFYVIALLTYINYVQSADKKVKWYLLTLLWSVLAYFSKIQAVSLPLSMIAIDIYLGRKWLSAKSLLVEKMPWWIMSLAFAGINLYYLSSKHVLDSEAALAGYNIFTKLAAAAYAYLVYLVKFIYPYKLVAVYPFPVIMPFYYYMCLGFMPVLFFLVWKLRRNKYVLFGILFFTVNIMFLLQVISAGRAYLADRFTYIAYIGLFFIFAKFIEYLCNRFSAKITIIYLTITCYVFLLSAITFKQCKVWDNTTTLWQHYIDENKDDYFGYLQLGCYLMDVYSQGNPAINAKINVSDPLHEALAYMHIAVAKDSLNGRQSRQITANIFQALSLAYIKIGDMANTEYCISKALYFSPGLDGFSERAILYYEQKKYDLAIPDLTEIIRRKPADDIAYYRRALCNGFLGRYNQALPDIDSAIHYSVSDPKYFIVRAQVYRKLNNVTDSRIDAERARQMGGKVPAELLQ